YDGLHFTIGTLVLNLERVKALDSWLKTTNITLTQVNGQRKYGGPPEVWAGPAPGPRCEVFISQIPRDAYEDLLIPLFSSVGPLWEFRLMMNFSGQNRGFAYAKYGSSAMVSEAIRSLHGHMLEPGYRLCVRRSTEKRHLCMGELPADTRPEDLLQVLQGLSEGVERVSLKAGPGIEGVAAIVAFSSHHTASMAKKILVEAFNKRFNLSVSIKWHSTVKPGPDESMPPPQPFKNLASSPVKPQRCILGPTLSPHLLKPPSIPQGFCRAVGGPSSLQSPHPSCSSSCSQGLKASASSSPTMLLCRLCEMQGFGRPVREIHYSHAGSDGFLYFTYKVCIPGISQTFTGLVMILPGPSASSMLEEASQATAQQVLQALYHNQGPKKK
uniref:Dead end protein 1-like n=1 Tax=Sphaeramia orbicularis TaxID=375764 RepID=A0A672Z240_9TELE